MYVERTHENGHLQPAVVEIFIVVHLFDHDHLSVGRSDNSTGIHGMCAGWDPEKGNDEDEESGCYDRDQPGQPGETVSQKMKCGICQGGTEGKYDEYAGRSFLVNCHAVKVSGFRTSSSGGQGVPEETQGIAMHHGFHLCL